MRLEYQGPDSGFNKSAARMSSLFGSRFYERPDWHAQARCGRNGVIGDDPAERTHLMFPHRGDDSTRAREVCVGCPVLDECRRSNETIDNKHAREVGVWFGTSGRQRRSMTPPQATCPCGELFDRTGPGHLYCSDECRIEARRASTRRHRQRAS